MVDVKGNQNECANNVRKSVNVAHKDNESSMVLIPSSLNAVSAEYLNLPIE